MATNTVSNVNIGDVIGAVEKRKESEQKFLQQQMKKQATAEVKGRPVSRAAGRMGIMLQAQIKSKELELIEACATNPEKAVKIERELSDLERAYEKLEKELLKKSFSSKSISA